MNTRNECFTKGGSLSSPLCLYQGKSALETCSNKKFTDKKKQEGKHKFVQLEFTWKHFDWDWVIVHWLLSRVFSTLNHDLLSCSWDYEVFSKLLLKRLFLFCSKNCQRTYTRISLKKAKNHTVNQINSVLAMCNVIECGHQNPTKCSFQTPNLIQIDLSSVKL